MTIEQIAKWTNQEVEELLFALWENGHNEYQNPKTVLKGVKLRKILRLVNLPNPKSLSKSSYWEMKYGITSNELHSILEKNGYKSNDIKILKSNQIIFLQNHFRINNEPDSSDLVIEADEESAVCEWRIIGHENDRIRRLNTQEVLEVHNYLVVDFKNQDDPIEPSGPRDMNLLESAIMRQHTSMASVYKYPTVEMTGAAILHSLIHNHPFHNGNKRTALVSFLVFLDNNRYVLTCNHDDLFYYIMKISGHKLLDDKKYIDLADREVLKISAWVKRHIREIENGDRPLKYSKLKKILVKYDCSEIIHKNTVKYTRKGSRQGLFRRRRDLTTSFPYGGEGREITAVRIKKIRQDLELTEEFGIDSVSFYEEQNTSINEFVLRYRKILSQLSKL